MPKHSSRRTEQRRETRADEISNRTIFRHGRRYFLFSLDPPPNRCFASVFVSSLWVSSFVWIGFDFVLGLGQFIFVCLDLSFLLQWRNGCLVNNRTEFNRWFYMFAFLAVWFFLFFLFWVLLVVFISPKRRLLLGMYPSLCQ